MLSKKTFCAVISMLMAVLLMIMSVSVPVGALSQSATKDEVKIDAVLQDKIFTSSPDEKIPVYIWYADIDHKSVEKEVKEKNQSDY